MKWAMPWAFPPWPSWEDDGGNPVYGFDTEISPWDRHLVDRYGVTPTTDMEVVRSEPETAPGADPVFTVGEMTGKRRPSSKEHM